MIKGVRLCPYMSLSAKIAKHHLKEYAGWAVILFHANTAEAAMWKRK